MNAPCPKNSTFSGISTDLIEPQFANASLPIYFAVDGMDTPVSLLIFAKAQGPTDATPSPMLTSVILPRSAFHGTAAMVSNSYISPLPVMISLLPCISQFTLAPHFPEEGATAPVLCEILISVSFIFSAETTGAVTDEKLITADIKAATIFFMFYSPIQIICFSETSNAYFLINSDNATFCPLPEDTYA